MDGKMGAETSLFKAQIALHFLTQGAEQSNGQTRNFS